MTTPTLPPNPSSVRTGSPIPSETVLHHRLTAVCREARLLRRLLRLCREAATINAELQTRVTREGVAHVA